jgi:hypothetical protein
MLRRGIRHGNLKYGKNRAPQDDWSRLRPAFYQSPSSPALPAGAAFAPPAQGTAPAAEEPDSPARRRGPEGGAPYGRGAVFESRAAAARESRPGAAAPSPATHDAAPPQPVRVVKRPLMYQAAVDGEKDGRNGPFGLQPGGRTVRVGVRVGPFSLETASRAACPSRGGLRGNAATAATAVGGSASIVAGRPYGRLGGVEPAAAVAASPAAGRAADRYPSSRGMEAGAGLSYEVLLVTTGQAEPAAPGTDAAAAPRPTPAKRARASDVGGAAFGLAPHPRQREAGGTSRRPPLLAAVAVRIQGLLHPAADSDVSWATSPAGARPYSEPGTPSPAWPAAIDDDAPLLHDILRGEGQAARACAQAGPPACPSLPGVEESDVGAEMAWGNRRDGPGAASWAWPGAMDVDEASDGWGGDSDGPGGGRGGSCDASDWWEPEGGSGVGLGVGDWLESDSDELEMVF